MKNLKRLGVAFALTFVLGVAAFAGETLTPPCAPPAPGETLTPPCSSSTMLSDDSGTPGETSAPPGSNAALKDVAEFAIGLLENALFF